MSQLSYLRRGRGRRRLLAGTMRRLVNAIALLLSCLLSASALAPHAAAQTSNAAASQSPPQRRLDIPAIDARINKLMQRADMVGMAVAIIENNKIVLLKGYGVTNTDTGQAVTPNTVFRWASLSKSVAAAAVQKLSDEGQIDLTDPAYFYAPSLHLPERQIPYRPANLVDILTQRTGLNSAAYDLRLENGEDPKALRADLKTYRTRCAPGDCYSYQNVAFDAASEAVETVTGESYADAVQRLLFTPLGMSHASYGREGFKAQPRAMPHTIYGERERTAPHGGYWKIPAAAGVNGSITDMAKWLQAHMGAFPKVLSEQQRKALLSPVVATPSEDSRNQDLFGILRGARYAMGWRVYNYEGHRLIGHRGLVRGYRSTALFDPKRQTGVAVLWNTPHRRPVGLPLEVFDSLYGHVPNDWMYLGGGPNTPPLPASVSRH